MSVPFAALVSCEHLGFSSLEVFGADPCLPQQTVHGGCLPAHLLLSAFSTHLQTSSALLALRSSLALRRLHRLHLQLPLRHSV